jgi:hypothetical protein
VIPKPYDNRDPEMVPARRFVARSNMRRGLDRPPPCRYLVDGAMRDLE